MHRNPVYFTKTTLGKYIKVLYLIVAVCWMRADFKGTTKFVSHNTCRPKMSCFDEWETKLLPRVQMTCDCDCLIRLGAYGYGMIRVRSGGEFEPSKVIGVHRLINMCQLSWPSKCLICATIRCVSMKNIYVWNLIMLTSRGWLSANQRTDKPDMDHSKAVHFSKGFNNFFYI